MDQRRLLLLMAERLYEDIKFVTSQNPTQIVDEDGTHAYNVLLAKTRKLFPASEFVAEFVEWNPRTIKYKDALVVAGQLYAMVKAFSETVDERVVGKAPAQAAPAPARVVASPSNVSFPAVSGPSPVVPSPPAPPLPLTVKASAGKQEGHDPELYGPAPVKRRDDGTIPFSME